MTAANSPLTVAAVVVAAGSGQRLGAGIAKAFVEIDGTTLLELAFGRFSTHRAIDTVVVVAPPADLDRAALLTHTVVVAGGTTRQLSVAAGLAAIGDVDLVLVHDVARPFVPVSVIDSVLAALLSGADAAVPVVPVHDTLRRVAPDGSFDGVVDRSTLVAIQTPQGFRRSVLVAAHESGRHLDVTDDAALVEAAGGLVLPVPGSDESFKITTRADLARAEAIARAAHNR